MADINDLEARLQQCKKVLSSVLDNMDYIEREIKIAKEAETSKSVGNTSSVSSADSFPSRGSQNNPIYQAGVHVNQGSFNANQGPVNQGPVNQGPVNQGQVNHGPVNFTQPQGNVNQNVKPPVAPQVNPNQNVRPQPAPQVNPNQNVRPQAGPQGNTNYGNPQFNPFRGPVNQGTTYQGNTYQNKPNQGPTTQSTANQGTANQPKKTISIEAIFGKNIMAIAASILIFISLILFATLILPKLSKEVKFYMTLVASMGIAAFGLIKWFKNKENSFFLALGACGMGSIYITLFIGNAYFGIIGYLALFILVAIWTAVIIFLSKYKKILFEIIGYCGICIAVMFGTVSSISRIIFIADDIQIQESNITRFGITVVFFLIGILAFMLFGKMDTISYIVSNSASLVCAIPLLIGAGYFTYRDINSNGEYGDGVPFILIILAIFYTAMLVMNLLKTKKENGTWINLFGLCYSITLGITVNMLFHDTSVIYIVSIIVYAITVIAIETFCIKKFSREKFVSTYIWLSYLLIMIAWKIAESDLINVNVGFLIVGAAMIIYGFVFNDLFYKICGLTLNVILLGCIMDSSTILRLLSFVGMFALINVFMYVKNSQYNLPIKLISYLTFLIGIAETIGLSDIKTNPGQWIPTLILLIIGIINALAMKTAYRKNWEINEDDQGMIITGYVVNAILMCYSLFIIMFMEDPLLHWLVVLIAVALFMLNSISLFHKWDGFGAIYVGLKFTVLIVTILASFDMTDNILSIIVFLLSIILISAGFIYKVKGLRIYGLVLSLICVIKLVMIDIAYENTVGHALSFFLSGVLCFVISAIYSHVEKKYKDNETNNVLNA